MTATDHPSIVVVLEAAGGPQPRLAAIESRATVRRTDAAGLGAALAGADVLLLWDCFSSALREAWPRAGALRWVHVAAAGVDTLLFDDLVASDVVVTNARGVFDRPMAEFALAAILAQAKRLHEIRRRQLVGHWQHEETAMLAGQTALVIGTGSIGRATARLLRAVGMRVRGVGRVELAADPDFGDVVAADRLADHIGWADHVVVLVPLTGRTRGLVDARVLAAVKPTAHLVNLARGPVVDEAALLDALRGRSLAAASLDVFAVEPLPPEHPLWTAPGVVVSSHLAGDVVGRRDALADQFVENALRYLDGSPLDDVVDKALGYVPSVARTEEATS